MNYFTINVNLNWWKSQNIINLIIKIKLIIFKWIYKNLSDVNVG